MEAAAMPLPSPETTPPVMKMYFVLMLAPPKMRFEVRMKNEEADFVHGSSYFFIRTSNLEPLGFFGRRDRLRLVRVLRREPVAQRRPPTSPMFRKLALHARDVLGPIDAEVRFGCLDNVDFKAVLQGPQLLERLGALQRRGREQRKSSQHKSLIPVQADVVQRAAHRRT